MMSGPREGERLIVAVTLHVPVTYRAHAVQRRAGWYPDERLSVLGFALEEGAIEQAERAWDLGHFWDSDPRTASPAHECSPQFGGGGDSLKEGEGRR